MLSRLKLLFKILPYSFVLFFLLHVFVNKYLFPVVNYLEHSRDVPIHSLKSLFLIVERKLILMIEPYYSLFYYWEIDLELEGSWKIYSRGMTAFVVGPIRGRRARLAMGRRPSYDWKGSFKWSTIENKTLGGNGYYCLVEEIVPRSLFLINGKASSRRYLP